ncbi:MAG: hypothetical protein US29_C0012G0001, partial [candidate division WS6 bacterium GW2011_GWF1_36_8]
STICNIILCMQDADVPMWDKGDKTDDYAKGGGGFPMFGMGSEKGEKSSAIEEAYELVLGRKPTSREQSYYRYSSAKKEEILKKLLNSDEHKEVIKKGRDYPELEDREKLGQSTILKLKHSIEDQQSEVNEMKSMLEQKNREIAILREEKNIPFVTQSFLEGKGSVYYGNVESKNSTPEPQLPLSWLDKLSYFIQKISK